MSQHALSRRNFIKASAFTGAALTVGASLAGCMKETPVVDAPVVKSTDGLVKMRTACHGCVICCPATAYLKDGVVVRLEGDKESPVNRGGLCIKGLNQLNTMYSPRRILRPIKRAGERGENKWEVISWDQAIDEAATHIVDAIDKYGPYSFFSSVGGGGAYSFYEAQTIIYAFGSPNTFEPGCSQCLLPRWVAANFMWGGQTQSLADAEAIDIVKPIDNKADTVVIWAAQPSVSQTAQSGRGMAEIRANGAKTIVIDPNFSPDAVKADIWLPIRPGSDSALALCWLRYIFENKLYNEEFTKFWTNMPFLIDPDTKLPVLAQELFPEFVQTTPDNTPAYVCYDLKTNAVAPFEFSAPKDATVDPEVFWKGEFNGKTYKTAGQIYKEEAEPWTLDRTAETCWLEADKIEAAIKMYAEAEIAGIVNGVAVDQQENSSYLPLGLMALDFIMGYVNKPGATLTQKGAESVQKSRPTFRNSFDPEAWGIGALVGLSEAENAAYVKHFQEQNPEVVEQAKNMLLDRLGMVEHKGIYSWAMAHIPSIRDAIATGEPYKPRVWFDMSGNKLAMLANAKSWYEVFPELDYVICQYPMLTSFQVEAADIVFPVREWLEEPMAIQELDMLFLQNECIHIGETVSHSIPAAQLVAKCKEKWGGKLSGFDAPGCGFIGAATEEENRQMAADMLGASDWAELMANTDKYVGQKIPDYWQYNQQEVIVDDGLPAGFATESRKIEVYCTMMLKAARTGYPYLYPFEQEPCEDYSPICKFFEPFESPLTDTEYPYVITSGRLPYFHHGTMRHAAFAREVFPTAEVRMNPETAAKHGISHMDWVKVSSRRGEVHARAYLTEAINPKTLWMERFWNPECFDASQSNPTAGWRECNINVLSRNTAPYNDAHGTTTNRAFTVKIEKSEKPANVWVEPQEFEPFMATNEMKAEAQTGDVF